MAGTATYEGNPTRELIDYYAHKAKGGAAVITVGESAVDNDYAITHAGQLVLGSDKSIPWLNMLAEDIQQYGAIASIEICHGGGQTLPELIGGRDPIGPNPFTSKFHEQLGGRKITVREMDEEMMEQVKENFALAAWRLKRAGFDMCLIHGGHGWLLSQFLSPHINKRKDKYGGCLENRARFPLEVLERIREKVGYDFGIDYRMSGDELIPDGLHIDEAVEFAQIIEDKVDTINVSAGLFCEPKTLAITHPTIFVDHGHNVYLAEKIKKAVKIPISCVGRIIDPEMAERIIAEEKADIVGMTRALIADPELPQKAQSGRIEDIRPCCGCLECQGRGAVFLPLRCAENPEIGRETKLATVKDATASKRVLIIGGGPAGMQAAITATSRGHRVTIVEKSDRLGGNLKYVGDIPFKRDLKAFLDYMIRTVDKLPVKVRLNTEASKALILLEAPDLLLVAAGAEPYIPESLNLSHPSVFWSGDVHIGKITTGNKVVIIGGGMIGCETALVLAKEGKNVTIIEMRNALAVDLNLVTRIHLLDLLEQHNVDVQTNTVFKEISAEGNVKVVTDGVEKVITADTVLVSIGLTPRKDIAEKFSGLVPEIRSIGDCVKAQRVMQAISTAFEATYEL